MKCKANMSLKIRMECSGRLALLWLNIIVFVVRTKADINGDCLSSPIVDKGVCKAIAAAKWKGSIVFTTGASITEASSDFGGIFNATPAAVLSPASVEDISTLIKIANASPNLTIAARGNGHSLGGQALALNGIVVNMKTLKGIKIVQNGGDGSYVDVKGGELWVDVLKATQAVGLAPRSWTDYIDLSIGGTLSNAGISGQSFRYGPEISNVLQLEVVTGKGEVVTCTEEKQSDLFFGALGGLGQFGIITGARIIIQKAYQRASQWRFVYTNFTDFMHDQELLISLPQGQTFDYVEGFVAVNSNDPVNGWPSIPFSSNVTFNSSLLPPTAGPVIYTIEAVLYYDEGTDLNEAVKKISSRLSFIKGLEFNLDTSLFDFLYRVHAQELASRASGRWNAPHPWFVLFVPKSRMAQFDRGVFNDILKKGANGIILTYPMKKSLWDSRTSAVIPDEDVFYAVSVLRFNKPPPEGPPPATLIAQNKEILDFCNNAGIPAKQYLGRQDDQLGWEKHFGAGWERFTRAKNMFDPRAILAPGQNIFPRKSSAGRETFI